MIPVLFGWKKIFVCSSESQKKKRVTCLYHLVLPAFNHASGISKLFNSFANLQVLGIIPVTIIDQGG
jgi:hypothetical protein